jgi:Ca2+-binding EF-hand superfamily protein|eukprot:3056257-Prymnesium_polylepis.1
METFDAKENGYITREALKQALTQNGSQPLDEDAVEEVLNFADKDHSGMINYEDFVKQVMQPVSG